MPDNYRIDSHKLIFHPERVAKWLEGCEDWEKAKKVYPIYLEISPVGHCNHRCTFCAKDYIGYQHREIPFEILKNTLTEMANKGIKSVMFAGEGEPTLYKKLPEILDHCTELGIDASLTTNMVPFTENNTESFIKNCKWIKVSINAGTSRVYSQVHSTKEDDFYRVLKNMELAVKIKNKNNYSCTLGAQMLLLPENFDTASALANKVKEIGFDYLVIKPYSQHLSSITTKYKDIDYLQYLELEKGLKSFNSEYFKVIFRTNTINKTIDKRDRYNRCSAVPFFWGYIMSDGNVYGCSSFLKDENFCYGSINERSFSEIWESDKRKLNYRYIKNVMDARKCRENCRMDEINRYLWELKNPGSHVNFI